MYWTVCEILSKITLGVKVKKQQKESQSAMQGSKQVKQPIAETTFGFLRNILALSWIGWLLGGPWLSAGWVVGGRWLGLGRPPVPKFDQK